FSLYRVLLVDFLPVGTTINADRYCETLGKLRRTFQKRRRGMLSKGVSILHDTASPHIARQTVALLQNFGWNIITHPPYSPDFTPSDYHLLTSNDFMNFFTNNIFIIREKITHNHPTDVILSTATFSTINVKLDSFSPIDLSELTSIINSSKPSTCLLDPIPTKLLKEVLPLINSSILNMINLSLIIGYVPQAFKLAVVKPLLKKHL
uniref:Tc1-like transposase DDE domain-containing protein n=1 Tax=Oreochromis niloticus TaxID=8128 RepID=A0A669AWP6_ORENI